MKKNFKTLGVMIDFSRNAVMTLDSLKEFLFTIRKMGYNTVFLYMEDTYEVEGEPYFGYMRARYSIEEMKEIDAFCNSIDMEAIPCIQTLAHMKTFFKWKNINVDTDDILLADDDRTYELIANMFKTLSECFTTRRMHIGMDEAHMLGRGKHLDIHGYETTNTVIKRHLRRICELAKPYNFELLLWSDMFIRPLTGGNYYSEKVIEIPDEVKQAIPENVAPVYWDYYHDEESDYDTMMKIHNQLSRNTWFAGGAWCWTGFLPNNEYTLVTMLPALEACRKNGIKNIFFTLWGDDGAECSHFSQLPALLYVAEAANGNTDEKKIKEKFKRIVGMEYDDFMKIDKPNYLGQKVTNHLDPSKYMTYSDLFLGFLDYTVKEGANALYAKYAAELREVSKKSRKYGYLFKNASALCDLLSVKYELGVKTRAAYKANDKEELKRLAKNEYTLLEKYIKAFAATMEYQWFKENKPSGFEVQDLRFGGLIQRTVTCRKRLIAYADGKLDKLEELEVDILPFYKNEHGEIISYNSYARTVTSNVISHGY